MTDDIHIGCVVDSNLDMDYMLAAMMRSVILNHVSGERLVFHIVDRGMSEKAVGCVEAMSSPSVEVRWLYADDKVLIRRGLDPDEVRVVCEHIHDDGTRSHMLSSLLMLFLPDIISEDIKKLLFIDADYIFLDDISKLWNQDFLGNPVAACEDLWESVVNGIPNWEQLGLVGNSTYFNGGLLMGDLEKWDMDAVAACIRDNAGNLKWWDQYVFNVTYNGRCLPFNVEWNVHPMYYGGAPWRKRIEEMPCWRGVHFKGYKPTMKDFARFNDGTDYIKEHRSECQNLFLRFLDDCGLELAWRFTGEMLHWQEVDTHPSVYAKYACHYRGDALRQGTGPEERNEKKAFEAWMEGAEMGDDECMRNVAWCYKDGIGVARDQAEADKWYGRADKVGPKGVSGPLGPPPEAALEVDR